MPEPTRGQFAALVSGLGWHVQDLARAAATLGLNFRPVPFSTLTARVGTRTPGIAATPGLDLRAASGVLIRMMPPGTLEQVVYRMDVLQRLEAAGVPLLNAPRAVEAAVDKYLTLAKLEAAGLPVPATWVGESARDALGAWEELGGDVVVKPLFGAEGRGLVRASDRELARRAFQTLERLGAVLYLQRVVRHPGFDYRAFVLGGRVVGSIRRFAPAGDWRTNVAVGGRAEGTRLDPARERLALLAARAVGADMAGVDLIDDLDNGTTLVLEVNAVPGWRALSRATGLDVAAAVLGRLREIADGR